MNANDHNKEQWDHIYASKKSEELSWTEERPEISLSFINNFILPHTAEIIDVGGGESKLADCLLDAGFVNISVLDISVNSIERAKQRLGKNAEKITWIIQDILNFDSDKQFACWHDRAAFHFLTSPDQISKYVVLAKQFVKPNGYLVVGSFSENGPNKCSGFPVKQYNQDQLSLTFSDGFKKLNCILVNHETPFKTKQNFLYCSFQRI